jgi:hypothetical protein
MIPVGVTITFWLQSSSAPSVVPRQRLPCWRKVWCLDGELINCTHQMKLPLQVLSLNVVCVIFWRLLVDDLKFKFVHQRHWT